MRAERLPRIELALSSDQKSGQELSEGEDTATLRGKGEAQSARRRGREP